MLQGGISSVNEVWEPWDYYHRTQRRRLPQKREKVIFQNFMQCCRHPGSCNCCRNPLQELEGIRLKNEIVPCRHNFDPWGSSLTWHMCHTRVHLPCKFGVSATVPSKIVSSSCCFAKGSRGGTWCFVRGWYFFLKNMLGWTMLPWHVLK